MFPNFTPLFKAKLKQKMDSIPSKWIDVFLSSLKSIFDDTITHQDVVSFFNRLKEKGVCEYAGRYTLDGSSVSYDVYIYKHVKRFYIFENGMTTTLKHPIKPFWDYRYEFYDTDLAFFCAVKGYIDIE